MGRVTHSGRYFHLGVSDDAYVIWAPGATAPIARYDKNPTGWAEAWRRFHGMESRAAVTSWLRSPHLLAILIHMALGAIVGGVVVFVAGLAILDASVGVGDTPLWAIIGFPVAILSGIGAWTTFVYLHASKPARAWIFFSWLLAGVVGTIIPGIIWAP